MTDYSTTFKTGDWFDDEANGIKEYPSCSLRSHALVPSYDFPLMYTLGNDSWSFNVIVKPCTCCGRHYIAKRFKARLFITPQCSISTHDVAVLDKESTTHSSRKHHTELVCNSCGKDEYNRKMKAYKASHRKPIDAACLSCGSLFTAKRSTATFCSSSCRSKHHRNAKR